MSPEYSLVHPTDGESNRLRDDLFTALGTILTRMELLQRVTMVTPGLTELERTVLLEGLAAAQAAAKQLENSLDALIARKILSDAANLQIPVPSQAPLTPSEDAVET